MTRLVDGRSGVRILTEPKDFSLLQNAQTGSGTHPDSYSISIGVRSRKLTRPGRDFDHSPPSSAEVKNEGSCASTPRIHLHGVNMKCINVDSLSY